MSHVSQAAKDQLLDLPGVHRVAESEEDGEMVVVVQVTDERFADELPPDVEGVPVFYEVSDPPQFLTHGDSANPEHDGEERPLKPGISIGPSSIAPDGSSASVGTGTHGFVLTDGQTDYISSNNHVLAGSDELSPGHTVIQPGVSDSTFNNNVGTLTDYHPMRDRTVTVDLAWGEPNGDTGLDGSTMHNVGSIGGAPADPGVGDDTIFSGRSSGVVHGSVTETNASGTIVDGQGNPIFQYEDCIVTDHGAVPGDSGSAMVLADGEPYTPCGQVFGAGGGVTISHKATNIEAVTGFEIKTESDGGGETGPTAAMAYGQVSDGLDIDAHASGSKPGSSPIASYDWTLYGPFRGVKDTATGEDVVLSPDAPGTHDIEVVVTDQNGLSDTREVTMTVVDPGDDPGDEADPPDVYLALSWPAHGERTVTGHAENSEAGTNPIASYNWTLIDAETNDAVDHDMGVNMELTAPDFGQYTVRCRVVDTHGIDAVGESTNTFTPPQDGDPGGGDGVRAGPIVAVVLIAGLGLAALRDRLERGR